MSEKAMGSAELYDYLLFEIQYNGGGLNYWTPGYKMVLKKWSLKIIITVLTIHNYKKCRLHTKLWFYLNINFEYNKRTIIYSSHASICICVTPQDSY